MPALSIKNNSSFGIPSFYSCLLRNYHRGHETLLMTNIFLLATVHYLETELSSINPLTLDTVYKTQYLVGIVQAIEIDSLNMTHVLGHFYDFFVKSSFASLFLVTFNHYHFQVDIPLIFLWKMLQSTILLSRVRIPS